MPTPKVPTPDTREYYHKEQLEKMQRMDNSASTKSFTIPLGLSSDRPVEPSLDATPLQKPSVTALKNEKSKRPNASSPAGAGHVQLYLDCIVENPRESQPLGLSSQPKSTGKGGPQKQGK